MHVVTKMVSEPHKEYIQQNLIPRHTQLNVYEVKMNQKFHHWSKMKQHITFRILRVKAEFIRNKLRSEENDKAELLKCLK